MRVEGVLTGVRAALNDDTPSNLKALFYLHLCIRPCSYVVLAREQFDSLARSAGVHIMISTAIATCISFSYLSEQRYP
jgi:hypothetical protein